MIFGKKEKFEFFCDVEAVHKLHPIEPIKNIKMNWVKDAKKMFENKWLLWFCVF